ncbi:hypothetical protein RhiirA5_418537 [Rhizophagus irregularis]|uniref:Uncharacterized protein n=1 Tax=Rhizophagus irregularis TaxID=588596 RepID=A0A2N0PK34_9GLOM|nr:hypothetical protein RhiirA5_418537 [Rhizophagus irregularis]
MKYSSLESSQQDESNGSKIAFLELIFNEKLRDFYPLISDKLTCFSSIFWDFIRTKKDSFGVDSLTTYSGRVCLALIMKRSASQ